METLEKSLVVAGLESLKQIGGETLVQVLLGQPGMMDFTHPETLPEQIPLNEYLRYRDTLLEFLQESFSMVAFQTGQILMKKMNEEKAGQIKRLIEQFQYAANKLPAIGQAAVLAAKDNPGVVRATMRGESLLVITIDNCPECRELRRNTPFCYLNQGLLTEFADIFMGLRVKTQETKCIAMGDKWCEVEVSLL
ncbi:MAG: 4-vinyl reductase [Acidobacteriota bacterium]